MTRFGFAVAGLVAAALLATAAVASAQTAPADPDMAQVDRASALISDSRPAEAVALLDTLIAQQQRARAADSRKAYCARSPAEKAAYVAEAARAKVAAVVLPQSACYSLFLKGFALVDLNRGEEAKAWIERSIAMAPSNAHFIGELAEWYKTRRDFPTARALFQRALESSALSPDDRKTFDKSRALRGLGYILIEDGRYDDAEALYRQCLAMDPKDARAQAQLNYIAAQRAKTR